MNPLRRRYKMKNYEIKNINTGLTVPIRAGTQRLAWKKFLVECFPPRVKPYRMDWKISRVRP